MDGGRRQAWRARQFQNKYRCPIAAKPLPSAQVKISIAIRRLVTGRTAGPDGLPAEAFGWRFVLECPDGWLLPGPRATYVLDAPR